MPWRRAIAFVAVIAAVLGAGYLVATAADRSPERSSRLAIEIRDRSAAEVRVRVPSSIPAGLAAIELRNRGDTLHDAQLFRVDGEHDGDDVVRVLEESDNAAKPRWLHPAGGVAPLAPDETATVIQVLAPGTYYVADTQEREEGEINAVNGGIAKIEVRGERGGELPRTKAAIAAREYGFDAKGIVAGPNRVTFRNAGDELHQVTAFRIPDGVPFARGKRAAIRRRAGTGWVPVDVPDERATTVLESGGEQIAELTFEPGRYVLLCFVSERAGGPPQWTFGMSSGLTVKTTTGGKR